MLGLGRMDDDEPERERDIICLCVLRCCTVCRVNGGYSREASADLPTVITAMMNHHVTVATKAK